MLTSLGEYRGIPSVKAFLLYANGKAQEESERRAYRVYLTDMAAAIGKAVGVKVYTRYADLINSKPSRETRTAEEIVDATIKGAGLEVM
jgi:hypothetical protein